MRIENRSAFHASKKLYRIADFITEYTRYSALATLKVLDTNGDFAVGRASKNRPDKGPLSLVAPSLVQLAVRATGKYPTTTAHVPEVGTVGINNWDEEVLFVLSHELAHIDQFMGSPKVFTNERAAEVAAERFAVLMLKRWRKLSL